MSTFIVISDTHFFAPGTVSQDKVFWNRVLQTRSDGIGRCLVETIEEIGPDFVIHCGDITGLCDPEHWRYACDLLDRLPCPWYPVLGNHDTWYPGVRDAFSAHLGLPSGRYSYRQDLAGMHFLFLDLAFWHDVYGGVSPYLDRDLYDSGQILGMGPGPGDMEWLQAQLDSCIDRPVVLVSHPPLGFKPAYPVATLPKGAPAPATPVSLPDLLGDAVRRDALAAQIAGHPNVKIAFAGHWHIHDATWQGGTVFCQTASLREFPFEIRVVEVDAGTMTVSTVPLANPEFQRASLVPEWGNYWVSGAPADRSFSLDLA